MARDAILVRLAKKIDSISPTLDEDEQAVIYSKIRDDATADFDFYALIFLASGIAYFGLQQNSGTTIIGAMLVAPLMSPMMAIGFSIINGNFDLFVKSARSTFLGAALAVSMAAILTYIFPFKSVTNEILARTSPNILDLFVALISGFAGAYAVGRKEVLSSLPGVAIAAALVPPLCVAGFGIGLGNWSIASNSLLLFLTNLASIIVAGIIMFWLLGFRPDPSTDKILILRHMRFALLGVLVVAIPLTYHTVTQIRQAQRLAEVQRVLTEDLDRGIAEIEDIVVKAVDDGFLVSSTIYLYETQADDKVVQEQIVEKLQRDLERAVSGPVTIRARVLPAKLAIIERGGIGIEKLNP